MTKLTDSLSDFLFYKISDGIIKIQAVIDEHKEMIGCSGCYGQVFATTKQMALYNQTNPVFPEINQDAD